jgi:hypothetical protein
MYEYKIRYVRTNITTFIDVHIYNKYNNPLNISNDGASACFVFFLRFLLFNSSFFYCATFSCVCEQIPLHLYYYTIDYSCAHVSISFSFVFYVFLAPYREGHNKWCAITSTYFGVFFWLMGKCLFWMWQSQQERKKEKLYIRTLYTPRRDIMCTERRQYFSSRRGRIESWKNNSRNCLNYSWKKGPTIIS